MKNIRYFIFGSSLVLAAWLTASYTAQINTSDNQTNESMPKVTVTPTTQEMASPKTNTATIPQETMETSMTLAEVE